MTQQEAVEHPDNGEKEHKEIVYFVNGERELTHERALLAAKTILGNAGFEPVADWALSRDHDGHEFAPDDLVEVHEDERFTAKRKGPTPTS
jgi:hypothetical protein